MKLQELKDEVAKNVVQYEKSHKYHTNLIYQLVSSMQYATTNINGKALYRLLTFHFSRDMNRIVFNYKATSSSHDTILLKSLEENISEIVKYLYSYDHGRKVESFERYLAKYALPHHLLGATSIPDWVCGDILSTDGGCDIKTNFDLCCESVEDMASIIDIVKIGWSKDDIIEWLNKPAHTDLEEIL